MIIKFTDSNNHLILDTIKEMGDNIVDIIKNLPLLPELSDIIQEYDDIIERKYANCLCCKEHVSINPKKWGTSWIVLSVCEEYEVLWWCECKCQCVNTLASHDTYNKWESSKLFFKY
jgi:hypothetical protein